jgi:hypothetical protein
LYEHYDVFQAIARKISDKPPIIGRQIVWIDSQSHRQILEEQLSIEDSKGLARSLKPIAAQWMEVAWEQAAGQV